MTLVLLVHLAATLFMVGVIWFVQIVHYPLFARVDAASFPAYEIAHVNRVTTVVGPMMFVEAITALLLLVVRPPQVPLWAVLLGLALVGVIWLSTLAQNVPQHNALSLRFDAATHQALLATNWIRTVAWTARAVLVLGMTWALLPPR